MENWKLRSNSGREEQRRPESVAGELQFGIGRELSLILKEIKVALVMMMVMRVMMMLTKYVDIEYLKMSG